MATPDLRPFMQAQGDFLDLVKLEHVMAGIYIWEYFTTLDAEWRFFRGHKRGVASTAWIYSLCKLSGLVYTLVNLIGLNAASSSAIDCQAWIVARFVFATLAVASASALTVIRISALWDRNIAAVLIATGTSLALTAFWLRQNVLSKDSVFFVSQFGCAYNAPPNERPLATAILAANVAFLALLTAGLIKRGAFQQSDWWRAFYVQGVAWLLLSACFAVPGVVMIFININGAWNQMLRGPELLIIIIGATRLYSTLTDRGSFTIFNVESSMSSGDTKPTQLEALKFRSAGHNANTVTFDLSTGGLQTRSVPVNQESKGRVNVSQVSTAQKAPQIADGSIQSIPHTDQEGHSDIVYIGKEEIAP